MKDLPQASIGTAPLWLMRGRKAQEQVVILYVWEAELMRAKWSFASIQRSAGISSASVVCKALCDDGLLKTQDAPHRGPYTINLGWLPVSTQVEKPADKPALPEPEWVKRLRMTWAEQEGFARTNTIAGYFGEAVEIHGIERVAAAMGVYLDDSRGQEKQYRSIKNLAEHLNQWIGQAEAQAHPVPGNQSLASLG